MKRRIIIHEPKDIYFRIEILKAATISDHPMLETFLFDAWKIYNPYPSDYYIFACNEHCINMIKWIEENYKPKQFKYGYYYSNKFSEEVLMVHFFDKKDAALFKLFCD